MTYFGSYMYWQYVYGVVIYIMVYVATNMFMVLQVIVLLSYMGFKFCVSINLSIQNIYLKYIGGGMG